MEFNLSQDYIRKQIRGPFVNMMVISIPTVAFVVGNFVFESVMHGVAGLIVLVVILLILSIEAIKKSKYWKRFGPSISVSVHDDYIIDKGLDGESKIAVQAIDSVQVKMKKGDVRSINLKSVTGMNGELKGYENMKLLSEKISSVVGEDKVSVSRSFF
ncbi:hypothetical protein [Leucothrix arctica]|uniref:DUF304 domain-containing protein n=1 Tax=Leucothrix arctica TaxID=1481894 RepID=A0A317C9R2_9GAMM|nr:hypothetical protein [Leucothrix arctica]PWQ95344.1 hypothetical protein DKT75_13475 [Leucothrix arctica]